jgi:hypothetical protein
MTMANDLELIVERHSVQIQKIEEYQKKQNGAIEKLANQYEGLRSWLIALLTTALLNLGMLILNMMRGG